jgi:hypothetical protein
MAELTSPVPSLLNGLYSRGKVIVPPVFKDPAISPKSFVWEPCQSSQIAALASAGISVATFERFRDLFVRNPFDYSIDSGDGFRDRRNAPLNTSTLIRHLTGQVAVGTRCGRSPVSGRFETTTLCLDLDAGSDLLDRFDRVSRLFPIVPEVIQSSASGGLHLWWFFDAPVELFELFNPYDKSGIVPRLLEGSGLRLENSLIECFPQALSRDFHGNALRLPFGKDSFRLSQDELVPDASTPIGSMHQFFRLMDLGHVEYITLDELRECCASVPARRGVSKRKRVQVESIARSEELKRLDEIGLTGPGQFNQAVFRKALDYCMRGYSESETCVAAAEWLDAKHNGKSDTYNRSPKAAHAELAATVASVYRRFEQRTLWAPLPELTLAEWARIVAATPSVDALTDANGTTHSTAKYERFVADIIRGMKQWVVTQAERDAREVAASLPTTLVGSAAFVKEFAHRARKWWPAPAVPFFCVPCSYNYRRTMPGVSDSTMHFFWKLLRDSSLFRLSQGASQVSGRCETFTVELDFENQQLTHGEALLSLLPASSIRDRYSEHHAKQLIKGGRKEVMRSDSSGKISIKQFAQRRLSGLCTACATGSGKGSGASVTGAPFSDGPTVPRQRKRGLNNENPPVLATHADNHASATMGLWQ